MFVACCLTLIIPLETHAVTNRYLSLLWAYCFRSNGDSRWLIGAFSRRHSSFRWCRIGHLLLTTRLAALRFYVYQTLKFSVKFGTFRSFELRIRRSSPAVSSLSSLCSGHLQHKSSRWSVYMKCRISSLANRAGYVALSLLFGYQRCICLQGLATNPQTNSTVSA